MLGKEDQVSDLGDPGQVPSNRKLYWRSASWSSSRTSPLNTENAGSDSVDPNVSIGNVSGHNRRFPVPLTPRSQQNLKGRSCLPPLQPLSIARRSLDEWPKAGSDDIGEWLHPPTPRGDVNKSGERLKLDLSGIQHNPENKGGGLVRRDKIAFFDKECSKVAEHVYFGGDAVARDKSILKHNGITHILNCVGFVCPEYFKADFIYRTLWLQDSPSEDITSILYDVFDYFEDVREQQGRVFVHCCQGVSRSTSLVIAYRMWREGQGFDEAFQYVKEARGIADPNMGFACQLLQCQKRVHAFPLSPSSLLRLYRIAPHSPYDPLHLVPKMLNDPSPSALDSRGAFILHVPSAIYVWIGKICDSILERDARGAVNQIVRYEKVQGPIVMIKEGDEPPYFWNAFSNLLPSMDKSLNEGESGKSLGKICPGDRRVDSYNVDFEIFRRAIKGGFVPPFASSETEQETCLPARESSWSVLRRKFASGNMKEFVSASKLFLSRIYPDSVVVGLDKCVSKPSSSSAISLSSSSPSFSSSSSTSSSPLPLNLSPDSITSNSSGSSKYFSESPLVSPTSLGSHPPSSIVPTTSSNLTRLSPKTSPQPRYYCSEFNAENFVSQSDSQSTSFSTKKSPVSLAERRGSMSRSLKLPVMTNDTRETISPTNFGLNQKTGVKSDNNSPVPLSLAERRGGFSKSFKLTVGTDEARVTECQTKPSLSQEDSAKLRMGNHTCSLHQPEKNFSTIESNDGSENGERDSSQQCDFSVPSVNPCREEDYIINFDSSNIKSNSEVSRNSSAFSCKKKESTSVQCNQMQPLIRRWPSLEKIDAFSRSYINSESAFVFITQDKEIGKCEHNILYFWIGRSFRYDKSQLPLECSRKVGDREEIDWNSVGCNVLVQMGLPRSTSIKIVKEDKEPEEFLALLSSLYNQPTTTQR